jgi:hypothetical protein
LACKLPSEKVRVAGQMALKLFALSLAFMFTRCYEDLPPVEQPEVVQSVGVSFNVASDGLVFLEPTEVPRGNVAALKVNVTNLFNEYMADDEQIEVEVRVYMKDHPERSAVVTMSKDELMTTGVLSHGVLAIAPHQVITIATQWSHNAQGKSFFSWAILDGISAVNVATGSGKSFQAFPVHLMLQASIKVFKSRPTEYYPADRKKYKEFVLYYSL